MVTIGQRILMRGCILRRSGQIFNLRKVDMTPASQEQCSRLQQVHWCRYWFFCVYNTAVTCSGLQYTRQPQKLSLILGDLEPM